MNRVEALPALNPAEVAAHMRANRIHNNSHTRVGMRCGDGRDSQEMVHAVFGGALGYAYMVLEAAESMSYKLKTEFNPENIVDFVYEGIYSKNKQINLHSDQHPHDLSIPSAPGCGFNKLAHARKFFSITDSDIQAVDTINQKYIDMGKVAHIDYEGDHEERAVLLVEGHDGVKAKNSMGGSSVFVLHLESIRQSINDIAHNQKIQKELGIPQSEIARFKKELVKAWMSQTNTTAQNLAIDKDRLSLFPLPTFLVSYGLTGPRVSQNFDNQYILNYMM